MLYMVNWELPIENRDVAQKRFLETGAIPPEGVKLLGRWHVGMKGYSVVETDDFVLIGKWLQGWTDVLNLEVLPANTDEEAAEIAQA